MSVLHVPFELLGPLEDFVATQADMSLPSITSLSAAHDMRRLHLCGRWYGYRPSSFEVWCLGYDVSGHSVTMIVRPDDACLVEWSRGIGLRPHRKIVTGRLQFDLCETNEPFPAQQWPGFLLVCVWYLKKHLNCWRWGERRGWELVGPATGDFKR